MSLLSLAIGCGLAVLILTKIISNVTSKRRWRAEAAQQGCEPAPTIRNMGFLGLKLMLGFLKASHEERGPQHFVKRMNELGTSENVHTVRIKGDFYLVLRDKSFAF